jgi:hypothetical protein
MVDAGETLKPGVCTHKQPEFAIGTGSDGVLMFVLALQGNVARIFHIDLADRRSTGDVPDYRCCFPIIAVALDPKFGWQRPYLCLKLHMLRLRSIFRKARFPALYTLTEIEFKSN